MNLCYNIPPEQRLFQKLLTQFIPPLIRLPERKARIDYDKEADVLYISLKRPQKATDTKFLSDKGILLRYRAKDLVGVTVLDASKLRNEKGAGVRRYARHPPVFIPHPFSDPSP